MRPLLTILLLLGMLAAADASAAGGEARECARSYRGRVVALVNKARNEAGLPALKANSRLRRSSRAHSLFMARSGILSHDGWVERIRAAGFAGGALGQNVAGGYSSPAAVMTGWLGSEGHRGNILNPGYSFIGVGCVRKAGVTWWTQDFGG